MADGFHVDLAALSQAAHGVGGILGRVAQRPVAEIDCPSAAFGHERLATATSGFCDRWAVGVANLTTDLGELGTRLAQSLDAYRAVEQSTSAALDGTGPDPAPR